MKNILAILALLMSCTCLAQDTTRVIETTRKQQYKVKQVITLTDGSQREVVAVDSLCGLLNTRKTQYTYYVIGVNTTSTASKKPVFLHQGYGNNGNAGSVTNQGLSNQCNGYFSNGIFYRYGYNHPYRYGTYYTLKNKSTSNAGKFLGTALLAGAIVFVYATN